MRLAELNFKNNIYFLIILFIAVSIELIVKNLGMSTYGMPNLIMCVVFSFAYLKRISIWTVFIGVFSSEAFFSTTPILMSILIMASYVYITKIIAKGSFKQRNFHIIVFMLISLVIYSIKILWLFMLDQRPEVTLILIKMLVTIIFFPLFYMATDNFLKRY